MDLSAFERDMAHERRARLSAERRLVQKERELQAANRQLSNHALSLSSQIINQRETVKDLEGQNNQFSEDLEKATKKAVTIEKLLWNALDSMRDGFALFDEDRRLVAANRNYLSISDDPSAIKPGSDVEDILDYCLDEGVFDLNGEAEDEWFDWMHSRWDNAQIEPITLKLFTGQYLQLIDRHTSEGGVVSLVLDITDTISRENDLREARDNAQAADRAKSTFLAKMSHELRTPMNGVVGMAELLLEGEEDDERRLFARTIKSSGEALLEIINDVLDFSKIEADKLVLKPKPFDLERLMQEVALIVEPTVNQKGLSFQIDYDKFLPTAFVADPGRLRQIMTNLVGNAVKFTEKGHVLIRVLGIQSDDRKTCDIHVTVEDTGIGIDPSMAEHIFGEFNQIEEDANRKYEGTGLGLAISRKLIEHMGGSVWLESVKGEGSCFGFKLTLPTAEALLSRGIKPNVEFETALIVESNRLDALMLSRQLELLDIDVQITEDWSAAEPLLKKDSHDLVFISERFRSQSAGGSNFVWIVSDPDSAPAGHFLTKPLLMKALSDLMLSLSLGDKQPVISAEKAEQIDAKEIAVVVSEDVGTESEENPKFVVLAAEDNKTNQLVFKKMIKGLDIELVMANNGREAVESFQQINPDIIFMDISMPEMDGLEATKRIRELESELQLPATRIIAMTAHAVDGDKERITASGLDHYMTKPLKKALIHDHILSSKAPEGESVK